MEFTIEKKHIPGGFEKEYIPSWTEESQQLYEQFVESGDSKIADNLLPLLDSTRFNKWELSVEK